MCVGSGLAVFHREWQHIICLVADGMSVQCAYADAVYHFAVCW